MLSVIACAQQTLRPSNPLFAPSPAVCPPPRLMLCSASSRQVRHEFPSSRPNPLRMRTCANAAHKCRRMRSSNFIGLQPSQNEHLRKQGQGVGPHSPLHLATPETSPQPKPFRSHSYATSFLKPFRMHTYAKSGGEGSGRDSFRAKLSCQVSVSKDLRSPLGGCVVPTGPPESSERRATIARAIVQRSDL